MHDRRTKPTVLIVEDEFFLRCDLADEFRRAGYKVLEAATVDHAMAVCHDGMPVHVLITDVRLNGSGSGWDVAKVFRARWEEIPVVYTSGNVFDAKQSVPIAGFSPSRIVQPKSFPGVTNWFGPKNE